MGPASSGSQGSALPRPRAGVRALGRQVAEAHGAVRTRPSAVDGVSDRAGRGHAAAVVRSDAELVGAARTHVETGLGLGDLVVVAGTPSFARAMADEFASCDDVLLDDRIRLNGRRAPEAIAACLEFSRRAASEQRGIRLLAEVDQSGDPRDVREFACFESAANLMSVAAPASLLCLYDARHLPADLVSLAARLHPLVADGDGRRPSDAYADPRDLVRSLPLPREPLQDGTPVLVIDDAATLASLRHALGAELTRVVHDREQREDLHLGLSEMAANAFRHGARPVSARIWASSTRLVCTISDAGRGVDPLAGYWPAHGEDLGRGGMGLWLARKLFDHVDLTRDGGRTVVRLATSLR